MINFTEKVALITGGGGEIGRAAAIALARAGAKVAVVDISCDQGNETVRLIKEQGGEAIFICADVSSAADVQNYVKETLAVYGRIDVFLNNAAWEGAVNSIVKYPDDIFDKVMAINVRGVFLGLKHVLPVMITQRSGAVVNTGSTNAFIPSLGMVAYTASKHAVLGITKTAALENGRYGIRVNAVCPGAVNTRMLRSLETARNPENAHLTREMNAAEAADGRIAEPEEVANLMLYLASDMASHITGQSVRIDGEKIMN